jgi:oxygen-independent coproporphyrinogen-3 oxidase
MTQVAPRAAYVHVPFCAHRCGYCDFAIAVGRDDAMSRYVDAVAAEVARLGTPRPVDTLFLGGGTPSALPTSTLARLLDSLRQWLSLQSDGEVSLEANPDTLDDARLEMLASRGVNRISLGVQSFQPSVLAVLERTHAADDVPGVIARVRRFLPRLSVDLIFGAPGQTESMWRDDLARALDLGAQHVSTYGLTYEKGTSLWKARRDGLLQPQPEEAELLLYEVAQDVFAERGWEHYEISSFASPGQRCRHNQVYWANDPYFGFGMAAARYVNGVREVNVRNLDRYITAALAGDDLSIQREELPPEERARETMALNLRRIEGIVRADFEVRTGFTVENLAGEQIAQLVEQGFLADTGDRIHLTRQGKAVADAVVARLL